MKLFDKPWLEIVNINMNEVIVTSPAGFLPDEYPDETGEPIEGE